MHSNSKIRTPQNKGFSLLEALVAIGMLSVVTAAFFSAVIFSRRLLDNAERKFLATKIAQEGMELFISKRNNNIFCIKASCGDVSDWKDDLFQGGNCDQLNHQFQIFGNEPGKLLPGETLEDFDDDDSLCYNNDALKDRFVHVGGPTCPAGTEIPGNPKRRIHVCTDSSPGRPAGFDNNNDALSVQSIVEWKDRSGDTHTITLEKALFGTQP